MKHCISNEKNAKNCCSNESDRTPTGGGGFAAGNFRHGMLRSRFISHAVLNVLWEIFAPTCCEPIFGWWWLLLFADALLLSPKALSFLPDELLVSRGGLLFLLGGCCKLIPGGLLLIPGGVLLIAGGCCHFQLVAVIF